MLKIIPDLPANIFGYAVIGRPEITDYLRLQSAFHKQVSKLRGGANLLIDVTEAEGLGNREFWEMTRSGLQIRKQVQRLVLIGPELWTEPFDRLAKMLNLAEQVNTYQRKESAEAIAWAAGMIKNTP